MKMTIKRKIRLLLFVGILGLIIAFALNFNNVQAEESEESEEEGLRDTDETKEEIRFDLNSNYSVLHIIVDGEDMIFFQEGDADEISIVEDEIVGDYVEKDHRSIYVLDEPELKNKVIVEAYDAWGYPIEITAFNEEGEEVDLEEYDNNTRFRIIPLDGSVTRVLAGEEFKGNYSTGDGILPIIRARGFLSGVIYKANTMITSGNDMDASNNAVLAFAKSIGFDVDAYLSSGYAWKVVNKDPDGLYDTAAGKAMIAKAPYYGDGNIIMPYGQGLLDSGDIWRALTSTSTSLNSGYSNTWSDYARFLRDFGAHGLTGGIGNIECAGIVNTFFGYIHENLWDDDDWKLYYQAYNYGVMNNSFGYSLSNYGYNLNNVQTVNSGIQGMMNYNNSQAEYYMKQGSTNMTHDQWVKELDKMAPGAIVLFKPDLSSPLIQHTGLYIGKANGLHWMFHTNTVDYQARIIPMEYYSLSFDTGEGDSHKGTYIYRAGGRLLDQEGDLKIVKKSSSSAASKGLSAYDMRGIKYNIYTNNSGTESKPILSGKLDKSLEITTYDKSTCIGKSQALTLNEGVYWVQEDVSSVIGTGYLWNETAKRIEIIPNEVVEIEFTDVPTFGSLDLLINKRAARNGTVLNTKDIPSLEGAEFRIRYFDGTYTKASDAEASGNPIKNWLFKTKIENGIGVIKLADGYKVSGSDIYNLGNKNGIPKGTLVIEETKSPKGYKKDETVYTAVLRINEKTGEIQWSIYNGATGGLIKRIDNAGTTSLDLSLEYKEEVFSGDLNFTKLDIDGSRMSNIPFLIERIDSKGNVLEAHVVVTDSKGSVDTSKLPKTGSKVNSLDNYVKNGVFTDESKLDSSVGVWFGEDQSTRQNSKGSLIYGQYRIRELQCEKNKGQTMLSQIVFKDDLSDFTDGVNKSLSNIFIDLIVHPESKLTDDASGSTVISISKDASVTDEVRWDHLRVGQKYKLRTIIKHEDGDGNITDLGENTITFTPSKVDSTNISNGKTLNTVKLDTSMLNGGKVHAVDEIYSVNGKEEILIVTHNNDLNIKSQTLGVSEMRTKAYDSKTLCNLGAYEEEAEIIDTISYKDFPNGGMYIIRGSLIEKETGKELSSVEKIIRISDRVNEVAEKEDGMLVGPASGEITMPAFKFDARNLSGKELYVKEIVYDYDTDKEFLIHDDPEDSDQTIQYIKVETSAKDAATDSNTGVNGKTKIIDEVRIENAIPGLVYKVSGVLVYVEDSVDSTGEKHTKGEIIARHDPVEVLAEEENFVVEMTFEVDASKLSGLTTVVFEDLYYQDIKVATHSDYESEPQRIVFPKVKTQAWDKDSRNSFGLRGDGIVDKVSLENLNVGDRYKVVGTLHRTDGSAILANNREIRVESDIFTATSSSMEKLIEFNLDRNEPLTETIVVFEKLFHVREDEEGEMLVTQVASHEDPTEKDQSIYHPGIETSARDKSDNDNILENKGKQTIVDRVFYYGLKPGETYRQWLTVYDKETKEPIRSKYLKMPIKERVWFTPTEESGFIDVEIEVDAELLSGKTLVLFEETTWRGKTIATHFDFDNLDQTITIKKDNPPKTPKKVPPTGDDSNLMLYISLGLAALISQFIVAFRKVKRC